MSFPQHPTWQQDPAESSQQQWPAVPGQSEVQRAAPDPYQEAPSGLTNAYSYQAPALPAQPSVPPQVVHQAAPPSGLPGAGFVPPPPQNPYQQETAAPHGYPPPVPTAPLGSPPQPGYAQPGYAQPGYAQPGYAQPGYAQPGYAQPGYAQPTQVAVTPRPLSAAAMTVAGLAAVAGSVLSWMTLSAPIVGVRAWTGIETDAGRFTAALGLMIVTLGVIRFTGRAPRPRPLGSFAALTSLGLVAVGAWQIRDVMSAEQKVRDVLAGGPQAGLAAAVHVTVGPGLWLIAAAGVIGVVAGLLSRR